MTPYPPLFGNFPKLHPFLKGQPSLTCSRIPDQLTCHVVDLLLDTWYLINWPSGHWQPFNIAVVFLFKSQVNRFKCQQLPKRPWAQESFTIVMSHSCNDVFKASLFMAVCSTSWWRQGSGWLCYFLLLVGPLGTFRYLKVVLGTLRYFEVVLGSSEYF